MMNTMDASSSSSSHLPMDGIENDVYHHSNNTNNKTSSSHLSFSKSPLQPQRINGLAHQPISSNENNAAEVNKLSVSFAAEPTSATATTTFSSFLLLSEDQNVEDDEEEEEHDDDESPPSKSTARRLSNNSILDATTDDDFGRPYRRSRRQRKSVGFYKWLATKSPNEHIDQNGNPRMNTSSTSLLEDSMDTASSSEYDEEESEYVFQLDAEEDVDNDDEQDVGIIMNGDYTMEQPTSPLRTSTTSTVEENSAMPVKEASTTWSAPSSPTAEASAMPAQPPMGPEEVEETATYKVNEEQIKEEPTSASASASASVGPPPQGQAASQGTRTILSEPIGNFQKVTITTPLRRSPRKRRSLQGNEETIAFMPSIAEPLQRSPIVDSNNNSHSNSNINSISHNTESTSTTKQPMSPPALKTYASIVAQGRIKLQPTNPATPQPTDSAGESSSTNEILSQPAANLQKVVATPLRRSPRKRQSLLPLNQQVEEAGVTSTSSTAEVAPLAPISARPTARLSASSPASTEATAKSEPNGEASLSNEILSHAVEKNRQVITTPLRRSPRKRRQSVQEDDPFGIMSSIAEAGLSPIAKISSPAAIPTAKAASNKSTTDMASMPAETLLSNDTMKSPVVDSERTTPVTQSPFPSPSLQIASATSPVRGSPRKKRAVEADEPESVASPFATAELSPIQREPSSPVATTFQSSPTEAHFLSPQLPIQNEVKDSTRSDPAFTALLSQFNQDPGSVEQPRENESSVTMDVDETETINKTNANVASSIEKMECTTPQPVDQDIVEKEDLEEEDGPTSKSFVLEYSLEHNRLPTNSGSSLIDESLFEASSCYRVRIVLDKSPPPPPKGILRRKLRYTKSNANDEVEMENEQGNKTEHEEFDELDDTSSHGITLPELKHRMAILFPSDYSQLIQSSCDSARLIACFTLYKDALFVQNDSTSQPPQQQPATTAARARTRRRRLSLESKTPGISYLKPIMPFLNELVQLELVQYQSMSMVAKRAEGEWSTISSSDTREKSHRVHFPAFDGSALQPPSDVIEGSDRVREESIEQLTKVVKSSTSLFGRSTGAEDCQSESETKFDSRQIAINVLQNMVQYIQTDFVFHGHATPCSKSFPFKSHTFSRVARAAQSYAHDLSHVLRNSCSEGTPDCLTFPRTSADVSIANRISQSSRCGPWECRLADNAGQQIRYWLRTLLNPIPDRAPPKSSSSSTKAKQWRCRICDIVVLCVEDAEQSMAVEDGSMSSLVSDALSFLYALFGVSSWKQFVAEGESGAQDGTKTSRHPYFSSTITLKQNAILPCQWTALEQELIAATEFLAAMNGVRFLHELFSILVKEPKYHKVWKKTIQEFAGTLALVDETCIQQEDVQLLLLRSPIAEILGVLERISEQHSSQYLQCQNQLKDFSKRFAFGKKSKRKKRHQPHLGYLETAYEETMEKINFPRAMRL